MGQGGLFRECSFSRPIIDSEIGKKYASGIMSSV